MLFLRFDTFYILLNTVCSDFNALHNTFSQVIHIFLMFLLIYNHRPLFSSASELKNARLKRWGSAFLSPSWKVTDKRGFIFFSFTSEHIHFTRRLATAREHLEEFFIVFYHIYINFCISIPNGFGFCNIFSHVSQHIKMWMPLKWIRIK